MEEPGMDAESEHAEHEHHHEHGGHDHDEHDPISISRHEDSIIAVYKRSIDGPYDKAVTLAEAGMRLVAEEITAKGGIIGHIKAFVTACGDRCMLSLTDAAGGVQKNPIAGESAIFELVVIVFCIGEDELRAIIRAAFPEQPPR
jgi:hypothetical protein